MSNNASKTHYLGRVVFTIGALYMFALGWLYSWWVVPLANQQGSAAYSSLVGFLWSLSVPVGAFVVAIGAALATKAERHVTWLLFLLLLLITIWKITYTSSQLVSALFGIGGGLITLCFIGSTWQWARIRQTLTGKNKFGSDLRLVGTIFFVAAAWYLCGVFGVGNFVLRPELAERFAVPASSNINLASVVLILLVAGWVSTFFGQLMSRPDEVVKPAIDKVQEITAAD